MAKNLTGKLAIRTDNNPDPRPPPDRPIRHLLPVRPKLDQPLLPDPKHHKHRPRFLNLLNKERRSRIFHHNFYLLHHRSYRIWYSIGLFLVIRNLIKTWKPLPY